MDALISIASRALTSSFDGVRIPLRERNEFNVCLCELSAIAASVVPYCSISFVLSAYSWFVMVIP